MAYKLNQINDFGTGFMKNLMSRFLTLMFHLFLLMVLSFSKHSFASKNEFLLSQANQKINVQHDIQTTKRLNAWEKLVFHNLDKNAEEKLKLVNDFFNQMEWVEDEDLWNEKDYWATPIESLIKNAGDCEDFSIAKYYTLLAMDIPEEQLKITYVKLDNQQGHMVLFYYPTYSAEPLILDNMSNEIKTKSQRTDIRFMFSFNHDGFWLDSNKNSKPNEKNIINQWADMINRIKNE